MRARAFRRQDAPRSPLVIATFQAALTALITVSFAACTLDHTSLRSRGPTSFATAELASRPLTVVEPKAPPGVTQTTVILTKGNRIVARQDAPHIVGQHFNLGVLKDGDYSVAFNWEDKTGHSAYRGTSKVHVSRGYATPTPVVVSPIGVTMPMPVVASLEVAR